MMKIYSNCHAIKPAMLQSNAATPTVVKNRCAIEYNNTAILLSQIM